jgi:hypothetical protein
VVVGPWVGTMRRRGMGRRPARLMYAGFHRRSAFARKVPRTSVAPARGWWHRRAEDRSCSGGAQLGTPVTCWCSVAPKDLSDRGLGRGPRSRQLGHIGATLGPQTIRSERTTPDTKWFGILPAHRSDLAIRPRSPARSGRCPIGSVAPQRARCPRLHVSQPVNVTCLHQTADVSPEREAQGNPHTTPQRGRSGAGGGRL